MKRIFFAMILCCSALQAEVTSSLNTFVLPIKRFPSYEDLIQNIEKAIAGAAQKGISDPIVSEVHEWNRSSIVVFSQAELVKRAKDAVNNVPLVQNSYYSQLFDSVNERISTFVYDIRYPLIAVVASVALYGSYKAYDNFKSKK